MEPLNKSVISKAVSKLNLPTLPESILTNVNYYFDASPWRYIPGPWLMRVVVTISPSEVIQRYVAILGASDKNQRGLGIFDNIVDYSSRGTTPMPKALAVLFQEGKRNQPHVIRTNGFAGVPITLSDWQFLEIALVAVADFVLEAARLGGGGKSPDALNADEVLSAGAIVDRLSVGSAFVGFPCVQVIKSCRGDITANVSIQPTLSAFAHTETGGAVSHGSNRVVEPLKATQKICMVCRKTESDLLSRSGCKLLLCGRCKSQTERYCSVECQKADWSRHKRTCKSAV